MTKEQDFVNILDQLSLNSSSKNPLKVNINKENKALIQSLPRVPKVDEKSSLNKSKSGLIKSKVNPIMEMRIQDASVTINPHADGEGPIGIDEVNIQFADNLDER